MLTDAVRPIGVTMGEQLDAGKAATAAALPSAMPPSVAQSGSGVQVPISEPRMPTSPQTAAILALELAITPARSVSAVVTHEELRSSGTLGAASAQAAASFSILSARPARIFATVVRHVISGREQSRLALPMMVLPRFSSRSSNSSSELLIAPPGKRPLDSGPLPHSPALSFTLVTAAVFLASYLPLSMIWKATSSGLLHGS